jgi:hypothetical protein
MNLHSYTNIKKTKNTIDMRWVEML